MDAFSSSLAAAALVDGQHFSLADYGTLEGIYIPAWINHVNREVDPPRLDVRWTQPPYPQAQSFAELLVSTGATQAEADHTQAAWINAIESGDALEIGDLGTLRLDRETGLVNWVPFEDGLASAYWSGGAVAVEPLPKRAASPPIGEQSVDSSVRSPLVSTEEDEQRPFARELTLTDTPAPGRTGFPIVKLLRYAAIFALVVVGLALLRSAFSEQITAPNERQAVTVSQDRLNRSPLDAPAPKAGVVAEDFEAPSYNPAYGPSGAVANVPPTQPEPVMRSIETTTAGSASNAAPNYKAAAPATKLATTPVSPPAVKPAKRLPRDQQVDPADLANQSAAPAKAPRPVRPVKAAPLRGGERDVVIILGSFGSNENAARLTERLAEKGLLPYVDQPGKLTRVGVSFNASTQREIDGMLARMRREFNAGAWVL